MKGKIFVLRLAIINLILGLLVFSSAVSQELKKDQIHLNIRDDKLDVFLLLQDYKGENNILAYATVDRYMNAIFIHVLKTEGVLWFIVAILLVVLFFIGNHYFVLKQLLLY